MRICVLALLVFACAPGCAAPAGETPSAGGYLAPVVAGTIDVPGLVELSGLAASRLQDDTLWAHNDSLNEPIVYAIDSVGKGLGSFHVGGVSYLDWEDMASFELDGESYLVIGDVGDNKAVRPWVSLWFVREPALSGETPGDRRLEPAWQMHYRYEDGPRDCEALAVDETGSRILLLSKRTEPPVLYELPLVRTDGESEVHTARRLGTVPGLERPTGLDITPDGSRAVIQTPRFAYVFHREPGQTWQAVFNSKPQRIELPRMSSIEAATFDRRGRSIFVTREKRPNPLLRIDPATE